MKSENGAILVVAAVAVVGLLFLVYGTTSFGSDQVYSESSTESATVVGQAAGSAPPRSPPCNDVPTTLRTDKRTILEWKGGIVGPRTASSTEEILANFQAAARDGLNRYRSDLQPLMDAAQSRADIICANGNRDKSGNPRSECKAMPASMSITISGCKIEALHPLFDPQFVITATVTSLLQGPANTKIECTEKIIVPTFRSEGSSEHNVYTTPGTKPNEFYFSVSFDKFNGVQYILPNTIDCFKS